jgi:putative SOS response-associated peptidase YedK
MCGRFTLRCHLASLRRELGVEAGGGTVIFEPRFNIAPTQQNPILLNEPEHSRHITPMVWGIPRSRGAIMVRQINARAEAFPPRSARCAVISDGFYEWAGAKGSKRQPYFFHRADDALILMAGLWGWTEVEAGYEQTFAIVTTTANAAVTPIHDRMPAILEGDSLALWLNPKTAARDLPAPASASPRRAARPPPGIDDRQRYEARWPGAAGLARRLFNRLHRDRLTCRPLGSSGRSGRH